MKFVVNAVNLEEEMAAKINKELGVVPNEPIQLTAKEIIKDQEDMVFDYAGEIVLDTKVKDKQVLVDYSSSYIHIFKIEAVDENDVVVATICGYYEDIAEFPNSDYIDVGDAYNQETYDNHEAFRKLLSGIDTTYRQTYNKNRDDDVLYDIPQIWKPLFITGIEYLNKDVLKTLLNNLSGIMFAKYEFLPQELLALKDYFGKDVISLMKAVGFEKMGGFYHKSVKTISDECNVC